MKDPVTGVDVWVEHKPDLAWFKMIVPRPRIEPAPQPMDAVTRLRTILQNIDRKERDAADQGKAAESPERSQSDPCHVNEQAESTGALLQDVPAQHTQAAARSRSRPPRRIFPPAIPARPWRWNDRPASAACRSRALFSSCSIRPGMLSGSRRSLTLSLRDCSGETSAAFLPESSGSGPHWQAGSVGAGGDRRRGLLPALSPGRRPR